MFRLPFLFILLGMIGFAVFQLASLADLGMWMSTDPHNPDGLARAHLFVLGWGTMLAMGAVYQLISVVLQTQIRSERVGYAHFGCFTLGLAGLIFGFYTFQVKWIAGSASLLFIGILLFVWNVGSTLFRAKQWNGITLSVISSLFYLTLTALSGMAMGYDFAVGGLGEWHARLFSVHIWLGTLGWFGLLITGFSYKMLPMFYLAHHFPTRLQYVVLGLWNGGVLLGAGAFLADAPYVWKWMAFLIIAAAFLVYVVHMQQIYENRHKKSPGIGIRYTVGSALALALFGAGLVAFGATWPELLFRHETFIVVSWVYLRGWVGLTIFGYLSKIAPFLWWTHKYGPLVGKAKTPSMAELINERAVAVLLGGVAVSLFVLLIGVSIGSKPVLLVGGNTLSVFSLVYIGLIARVFTR